jgi:hypothetical protein|nr:MAG TPA: Protein of unknown function (DUF2681) [Caudoviricetes sp.]
MSSAILGLSVLVIALSVIAYFSFKEVHQLKTQLIRLRKRNLDLLESNYKNQDFIDEVVKINQAQAKKIQELKNRISF